MINITKTIGLAACIALSCLALSACGGETDVQTLYADGTPVPTAGPVQDVPNALVLAQIQTLQSGTWSTGCLDGQMTTLNFGLRRLTTQTYFYKDLGCLELNKNIQRINLENYRVLNQAIDLAGIIATRIDFETSLSLRQELFYFSGGQLYLGLRPARPSYTATTLDFQTPFQRGLPPPVLE